VNPFLDAEGRLRNGWWILAFLALAYVGGLALALLGSALAPAFTRSEWGSRLLGSVALAAAAGLLLRAMRRPLSGILGAPPVARWFRELGLGTLLGAAVMVLAALALRAVGGFHWERTADPAAGRMLWGAWVFLFVAAFEELLCRGFAFQRLVDGLGEWPAQLLMGGLFAAMHWGNSGMTDRVLKAWATLNIALAAVFLGLCYLRTRSLALPIGAHLGWNWTQGCLLGFPVSGTTDLLGPFRPVLHPLPDWVTGGSFGLEASALGSLAVLVAIVLLWRWKGSVSADPSTGQAPLPSSR
jgi:hypothetical protein